MNISVILSVITLFLCTADFALAMKRGHDEVEASGGRCVERGKRSKTVKKSLETTLKQAKANKYHGLHCGYYALWNALCSVDPALSLERMNRNTFHERLDVWENCVQADRPSRASVDNLEPNELDFLITSTNPALCDQITVVSSLDQIEVFLRGEGLSDHLLAGIKRFRQNNQTHAFIVNTQASSQPGLGHFIVVVFLNDGDALKCQIYNSTEHENNKFYLEKIINPLCDLMINEELDILNARKEIAPFVGMINGCLENYFRSLYLHVLGKNKAFQNVQTGAMDQEIEALIFQEIDDKLESYKQESNYEVVLHDAIDNLWKDLGITKAHKEQVFQEFGLGANGAGSSSTSSQ